MKAAKLCPCGNVAKYLCDKPVPLTRDEILRRLKAGERINGQKGTCDAPLCDGCRVKIANAFMCGPGGCRPDTVDQCRPCTTKEALDVR